MTSNIPDANGASRWETWDTGYPILLETLSKVGIRTFRSSYQGFPSLTSSEPNGGVGIAARKGRRLDQPIGMSLGGPQKDDLLASRSSVGVEVGMRLQEGWERLG